MRTIRRPFFPKVHTLVPSSQRLPRGETLEFCSVLVLVFNALLTLANLALTSSLAEYASQYERKVGHKLRNDFPLTGLWLPGSPVWQKPDWKQAVIVPQFSGPLQINAFQDLSVHSTQSCLSSVRSTPSCLVRADVCQPGTCLCNMHFTNRCSECWAHS